MVMISLLETQCYKINYRSKNNIKDRVGSNRILYYNKIERVLFFHLGSTCLVRSSLSLYPVKLKY